MGLLPVYAGLQGGVKISALRAAFGGCAPKRACGRSPAEHYKIIFKMIGSAGVNARPTMQGKHHANRKRAAPGFYLTVNLLFLCGQGPHATFIFIF